MRFAALTLVAATLGVACALLVACGSSDEKLIPSNDAASLKRYANQVGVAASNEDCASVNGMVARARARIAALPSSVDPELQQNLIDAFNNLSRVAGRDCQGTTETTTTETTPTETTTTETTDTNTDTTDTSTDTNTDTTDTSGDGGGGGTGNGNGNGNGSGTSGDSGGSPSGGTGAPRSPLDRRTGIVARGGAGAP
jgi:hypothetical protein